MNTILVIDDEPTVRKMVLDTLKTAGFSGLEADNGQAGVKLAAEHLPDLIISDIRMPDLDGLEMLKALRQDPRTNTIPVIYLTALEGYKSMREGMASGADDYLMKPLSAKDLLAAVRAQIQKRSVLVEKHDTALKILRKNIVYALPHELRTPLHQIQGFAALMELDSARLQPEEIKDIAQTILKSCQRLHRLIENYLVYAQVEVISADINEMQALRNHILKDSSEVIQEVATQKAFQHSREADLSLDLAHIALRISRENLAKIIDELADNAFKFSEAGSKVLIKSGREGDTFTIHVKDAGRGMTAEQVKITGAYMQFERTLFEQQGVGLGLTIARRLVEVCAGKIDIQSEPGAGTCVCVSFPLY